MLAKQVAKVGGAQRLLCACICDIHEHESSSPSLPICTNMIMPNTSAYDLLIACILRNRRKPVLRNCYRVELKLGLKHHLRDVHTDELLKKFLQYDCCLKCFEHGAGEKLVVVSDEAYSNGVRKRLVGKGIDVVTLGGLVERLNSCW